ncbi:hypothetical protein FHS76_004490 [Ochrobactrum daejeonense]|uniref:Uncharacterized protein n=1 Tax=Brucella daejeonensis TaxID=659015 RepID=A0A7W9B1L0_9HYPH|nr:hypothetical protein [Brucella daejeonensis]MBB5704568.1 hypothetical protein [Brucella daejeonensis]
MRNPNRNIVVEYKNKRTRKGSSSLWGNLDLKSIARQVEADAPQSPMEVQAQPDLPKPIERRTENATTKVVAYAELVIEQVEEAPRAPKLSYIDASGPEEVLIAMEELQTANMAGNAAVREKKPSVRRRMKKSVPFKREVANRIVAEPDIQAELSALENENADLKRELAARLRMENRQLHKMLRRLEERQ